MSAINRRTAIKRLGQIAGASVATKFLSGCGSGESGPAGIHHVVTVMMENRSFDHVFGARKLVENLPVNGLSAQHLNPNMAGEMIAPYPASMSNLCIAQDPPHGWESSRDQFAQNSNNGFVISHEQHHGAGAEPLPMSYLTREQQPVSYALADNFAICDNWFSSVMGPTWPNRMYWFSGQSGGFKGNEFPEEGWPTIFSRLDDKEVSWGYYFSDIPTLGIIPGDHDLADGVTRVSSDFLDDVRSGNLPSVSFVEPAFGLNDDHPPHHPLMGQQFLSFVYTALAESPLWENTLLLITYDEHGGFYDHVTPPKVVDDRADEGFDQLGFRVPTIVAGPYVKENYVSSTQYDHTSLIAHLTEMFDLEPLTTRSQNASLLDDCIDFERLNAGRPRKPVSLPKINFSTDDLTPNCVRGGGALPVSPVVEAVEAGKIDSRFDYRKDNPEYGKAIYRYLKDRDLV